LGLLNTVILSIAFSTNIHAALARGNVVFDWSSFATTTTTGDLVASQVEPTGDDGSAFAQGGLLDTGVTTGFGGLDLSSTGSFSSANLVTTSDLIDASAETAQGFAAATFERFFSFEAQYGSGVLILSVDVQLHNEVQGSGSSADAEALFGYEVGPSGVLASLAGLEMYGHSGDQSQDLLETLSFSVFMEAGDVVDMFAEGGTEVSAVPLPAAVWLFSFGLLGLMGMARQTKA
jgi:hypothetical protein